MDTSPHVVLMPSPGMGHLIPLVEFAKLLVQRHHLSATIIVPTAGPPSKAEKLVLEALPSLLNHIFLPPVNLPEGLEPGVQIVLTVVHSIPSLRNTLASLKATTRMVAFVADTFSVQSFGVAKEHGIPKYLFFPSNATSLSLFFHLPRLDATTTCEYRDLPEPIALPGCVPLRGIDLLDPVQDRSSDSYKAFLSLGKQFYLADGIILNTYPDIEEGPIKALLEEGSGKPPIYPIGPIIQAGSRSNPEKPECLTWLDGQPSESVLFVSFGSVGTLTCAQVTELALGLEASGQRFLWVVRTPNDKSSSAASFDAQTPNDPQSYLPEGFLGRTKEQGLVVPSWAPQIEVLSHGSVGGFITHCGWNSVLESVTLGVPLIAWPLYAEQKMNAVMLTQGIKVALNLKKNENDVVERDEIVKVVRSLMGEGEEGKEVREKAKDLKDAAKKALSEDGSSAKSLAQLASKWKNYKQFYKSIYIS